MRVFLFGPICCKEPSRALLFTFVLILIVVSPVLGERTMQSLDGTWGFRRSGEKGAWKKVVLPATFELHEGTDFDNAGTYRKEIPHFELPAGKRVVLHCQAVATEATVYFNGELI